MACLVAKPFEVPGLNKALKVQDLQESHNIYNVLPTDSQQPEILESHIQNLAAIFVRNRADGILGIHLAHAHFAAPENTTVVGAMYDEPYCRWARTTAIETIDLRNVHGHIFVLTDHGFHPYEYQTGPAPDLSGVKNTFLPELTEYLSANNLSTLIGLQIIDQSLENMMEFVLPLATVMLYASDLNGYAPGRQTGWKFDVENGEPRVCGSETHRKNSQGLHEVHTPPPRNQLETFQDVKNVLVEAGILCQ